MADAPLYSPQISAPDGLRLLLQPAPLPGVPSVAPAAETTAVPQALQAAGQHIAALGQKIADSQDETNAAIARTKYMTTVQALRDKYTAPEADYQKAEENFTRDAGEAQKQLLADIKDGQRRAQTELHMQVETLGGQRYVRNSALAREGDVNVAGLTDRLGTYARDAAEAPTPEARAAVLQSAEADIDKQAAAGWIHQTDALRSKLSLHETVADTDARKLILADPVKAVEALRDPQQFVALSPQRRQTLIEHAQNAGDQATVLQLGTRAHFDPAGAAATVGVVDAPAQLSTFFRRGILPAENAAGDPNAVSGQGAVGLSQILPSTARDMLRARGMGQLAGLDDAALTEKLKSDPALNKQLGEDYFTWLGSRYGGNLAAATAGYHAGPGNADQWVKTASAQFGPNFTKDQLLSVIPADHPATRAYLDSVWKNLGAPGDGGGLSHNAQLHGAAAVGAAINADEATTRRLASATATAARDGTDFAEMFRSGATPDPVSYGAAMQTNVQAARYGDPKAASWVRETQFQESMAPVRDEAYRMAPAHLAATVAQMEADQRSRPVNQNDRNVLAVLQETLKDVNARAKSDPVGLAERARIVAQPVALDPQADPADPNFTGALAQRGAQGAAAQRFYGGELKVLKPEEAVALQARYAAAGADEKFNILRSAGAALDPPALQSFLGQIGGGHDGTVFAGLTAQSRPELARAILQGGELLKSKEVQGSLKAIRPVFADKFGGAVYPDPQMQKAAEGAAIALYVSRAAQNGTLYADTADTAAAGKAIEDITGPIVKRNGVKTPIAPGIEPGRFAAALDHLSEADLQSQGGASDRNGNPVSAQTVAGYAVLRPLAIGSPHYVVGLRDPTARDGFAPLFTAGAADGPPPSPLVFDMAQLAAHGSAAQRPPIGAALPGARLAPSSLNDGIYGFARGAGIGGRAP